MSSAGASDGQAPFQAHVELLQFFLVRRTDIVERIQTLLNAQRKPVEYLQDTALLSRYIEDCFFIGANESQSRLRGQLEDAQRASGFKPRQISGLHNGLVDPAELMVRAFHLWQRTRWPGRNGRVRYAHTLFNVYVIRCLELLSLRLWDADLTSAGERLSQIQSVLDGLWAPSPADQPRLVRDARWLIPLAQSPATDDLGAYFDVAEKVAGSFTEDDRIAIHTANVCMAAGHLRSQIRYHSLKKGVSLNDQSVVVNTRTTNALDFGLLIQDLVPLLEAYEHAHAVDDHRRRLELADAICQGLSPDPELFLNRVPLLGAYSMIEHLFIATDGDGRVAYTAMGERHVALLQKYAARIGRMTKPLSEDCSNFRPVAGTYSPYGVLYGFSTDLLEHMALKAALPDAVPKFGLEDVFVRGDADRLAWVSGWRKLPHLTREVTQLFDYPQQFAEDVFNRLEGALRRCTSDDATNRPLQTGHLTIVTGDDQASDLPIRYIHSSDPHLVAANKADAYDEALLLSDRREARCVLSYQTPHGWVAITKNILTDVLATGRDVKIGGLPGVAAGVLRLMCRDLVRTPGQDEHQRMRGSGGSSGWRSAGSC